MLHYDHLDPARIMRAGASPCRAVFLLLLSSAGWNPGADYMYWSGPPTACAVPTVDDKLPGSKDPPELVEAVRAGDFGRASLLLEAGADPTDRPFE